MLVMFLLIFNVFDHRIFVVVRNGERTVPVLPMCERGKQTVLLDPFGGTGLDGFDQVRNACSGVKAGQNMHMVFDTVDAIQVAVQVFQNAPNVTEKTVPFVSHQSGHPIFR